MHVHHLKSIRAHLKLTSFIDVPVKCLTFPESQMPKRKKFCYFGEITLHWKGNEDQVFGLCYNILLASELGLGEKKKENSKKENLNKSNREVDAYITNYLPWNPDKLLQLLYGFVLRRVPLLTKACAIISALSKLQEPWCFTALAPLKFEQNTIIGKDYMSSMKF